MNNLHGFLHDKSQIMFHDMLEFASNGRHDANPDRLCQMVQPLDENQGPQQFCGHDPWLVCEVARTVHVWRLNHMKPEVCYYIFRVDVRLHPRL